MSGVCAHNSSPSLSPCNHIGHWLWPASSTGGQQNNNFMNSQIDFSFPSKRIQQSAFGVQASWTNPKQLLKFNHIASCPNRVVLRCGVTHRLLWKREFEWIIRSVECGKCSPPLVCRSQFYINSDSGDVLLWCVRTMSRQQRHQHPWLMTYHRCHRRRRRRRCSRFYIKLVAATNTSGDRKTSSLHMFMHMSNRQLVYTVTSAHTLHNGHCQWSFGVVLRWYTRSVTNFM